MRTMCAAAGRLGAGFSRTPQSTACMRLFCIPFAVMAAPVALSAQTVAPSQALPVRQQVIELQKGWNAVWLEVQPVEANADKLFAGTGVEICARYVRPVTPQQFIKSPAERPFNEPGWGVWYASGREEAVVRTMETIDGSAGYLVFAKEAKRWTVTGTVKFKPVEWRHGAFTMAGFSVDEKAPPRFREFFAGAGGRVGSRIYRLVNGRWQRVEDTALMKSGEACWIYAEGDSHYQGPLTVRVGGGVVDFGTTTGTITLAPENSSGGAQTAVAEWFPGSGAGGGLPVERVEIENVTLKATAVPVSGALETTAAGEASLLRLRIRRDQMTGAVQTGLIRLTDESGAQWWVPVRGSR